MKNKVVWITGASSGIGEALALACLNRGALVVLSARRVEELDRVRKESGASKDNCFIVPLDITETTDNSNVAQKVIDRFGRIDIMIHNAGISTRTFIRDASYSVIERVMEVNYFGTVALTQAVLPFMIKQKSGHFVIISSLMGKFSSPGRGPYAASKHALHGFFDALRMEEYDNNINVTIACPGFVHTDVTKNALTSDGDPQGRSDNTTVNGMMPLEAANRIIRAIEKNKDEIVFGGKETMGVTIKRFLPWLLKKMILRNRDKWELGNTVDN